MFPEKSRAEISVCLDMMGVDQSNVLDIAKAYCVCQWLDEYIGDRQFIAWYDVEDCLANREFYMLMRNYELYPIMYSAEGLARFCQHIRNEGLRGWYAMAFYYHYLPCVIADTSLFDSSFDMIYDGPVSSTLIYLILKYSGEALGTKKITQLHGPDIYEEHKPTMDCLGVSLEDFIRFWNTIHFLEVSEPPKTKQKIQNVCRVYEKMGVPKTILFSHYAMANRYPPKDLGEQKNPWAYIRENYDPLLERGTNADEELFNSGAYQISLYHPTDVIYGLFYKGRDDSRAECSLVLRECKRVFPGVRNILIVNPGPVFLSEYNKFIKEQCKMDCKEDCQKGCKNPSVAVNSTFAVTDKTVCDAYSRQFPKYRFMLISQLQNQLIPQYDHLIIFGRDYEAIQELWQAVSLCVDNAFISMFLPQSTITQKGDLFADGLSKHSVFVNWIMDVPSSLCQSKPRKKMFLVGRKGECCSIRCRIWLACSRIPCSFRVFEAIAIRWKIFESSPISGQSGFSLCCCSSNEPPKRMST